MIANSNVSRITVLVVCCFAALSFPADSPRDCIASAPATTALAAPDAGRHPVAQECGKLPLSFEVNRGQTDARVKFVSHGSGYVLFLTSTEAVLALRSPAHPFRGGQPRGAGRRRG